MLTFNYEIAIDYALEFLGMPLDYCLESGREEYVSLLKLHGSLNWTRCPKCNQIGVLNLANWFAGRRYFGDAPEVRLPISVDLPRCGKCGGPTDAPYAPEPLIVPPTWNKTQHYSLIRNVWSAAARHLSEAEDIVVIGYSLPPTDYFFHYLYALGTASPTRLQRFLIVNPDPQIRNRFLAVLGPLARERLAVEQCGFSESIPKLRNLLR